MAKVGYTCEVVKQKEVVLNLSEKCNNLCLNCPNDDKFRKDIIKEEDVVDFIREKITAETDRVTFIGGEPTILKNLFGVIRLIREINNHAIIQINSNGRMFYYDKFASEFLKFGKDLFEFHIALYGSTSEINDTITQIPGSFNQTVQGIKNMLDLGFQVDVRNIISKINYKDLSEFADFLATEFSNRPMRLKRVVLVGMDVIGNAYKNRDRLMISHLETAPMIEKCIDRLVQDKFNIEVHLLPKGIFRKEYYKYIVMSGCIDGAFVDSYGCNKCVFYGDCPRLLKSYVSRYGNREHHPIRKNA